MSQKAQTVKRATELSFGPDIDYSSGLSIQQEGSPVGTRRPSSKAGRGSRDQDRSINGTRLSALYQPPQGTGNPSISDPVSVSSSVSLSASQLGKNDDSASLELGDQVRAFARAKRFGMQAGARHLLPEQKAIQGCLRWRSHQSKHVDLIHKPLTRSARFGGLQTCGSVWMCPPCAAKITEVRRVQLGQAVRRWWDLGGSVILVTYTVRHKRADQLAELVSGVARARRIATGGKVAQGINRRYDVQGSIRSLEVTHGENGWHPHIHELLFLPSADGLDGLEAELRNRWSYAVEKAGLRDVNDHGVDFKLARNDIEDYVAKNGMEPWGVEHEVTKQASKISKGIKGRSPMQLLSDFSFEADQHAGELFAEYARVMKGRRQLYWSAGLKARLLPDELDQTDEEIAADVTDLCEVIMARFDLLQWQRILHSDSVVELLNLAAVFDEDGLRSLLRSIGISPGVVGAPTTAEPGAPAADASRRRVAAGVPGAAAPVRLQGVLPLVT